LTDGFPAERKAPYYEDQNWQGFWGIDLDVTIDLGQPTPLMVIRSDYLQRAGSGIYLPTRVQYAVSDDGRRFRTVATLEHDTPTKQPGPLVRSFEAKLNGVTARYIRVHAPSVRTIPAGLPAAGQKAWLFVDEIVINPSDQPARPSPAPKSGTTRGGAGGGSSLSDRCVLRESAWAGTRGRSRRACAV
jgi:hexosaminidase